MTGFSRFKSFLPGIVLLLLFCAVLFAMPTQDMFFTRMTQWILLVSALLLLVAALYAAAKPSVADREMMEEHQALEEARERRALEASRPKKRLGLKRALKR